MRLDLTYIYIILYFNIYTCLKIFFDRLKMGVSKFVNIFKPYRITIIDHFYYKYK